MKCIVAFVVHPIASSYRGRATKLLGIITCQIVPVFNSFVIFFLVSAVYSVVAVNIYGKQSAELFGKFSSALFTMFQFRFD